MKMDGLWGEEFQITETPLKNKKVIKKTKEQKVVKVLTDEQKLKSKKITLEEKLRLINENVEKVLGRYHSTTVVIYTVQQLDDYLRLCQANDFISIDTETDHSLDPLTATLVGLCLHTFDQPAAYIPVHCQPLLSGRAGEVTEADIKRLFEKYNFKHIVMHNAKFDYQVIKCTCQIALQVYWDTLIGARLLNENEKSAGLKQQYAEKIDPTDVNYHIDTFFEAVPYEVIDPEVFALYAATDAYKTTALYLWQKKQFEAPGMEKLYNLFLTVEMPIMTVAAEMELRGVYLDLEYCSRLSEKYHRQKIKIDQQIETELAKLKPTIDAWRLTPEATMKGAPKGWKIETRKVYGSGLSIGSQTQYVFIDPEGKEHESLPDGRGGSKSKSEQLSDPVSLSSTTQLAILLYDILKVKPVDAKKPRGTGVEELTKIEEQTHNPLCGLILESRKVEKLIGTYVDKLPAILNSKTGRLHGSFNQVGTDTGRFSSNNPNLQNIPSHSKDIRLMFSATPGYKLVGADFSQAEPRLLAWYSQDEKMIQAYQNKRDLYATVAAEVYNNNYEDNLEFYSDGSMNYEGKERRTFCKSIILGIMYGRGAASIAEQTGKTTEEAQAIIDQFYKGFPKVDRWVKETRDGCRKSGYVEDLWGRRRRLPDVQLPPYSIKLQHPEQFERFNPFLNSVNSFSNQGEKLVEKYQKRAAKLKGRQDYQTLKAQARAEGVDVVSNVTFISQAERQSVNARVQGGSATITKKAMIAVHNDPLMQQLDFHILLCIHDEIIGECPAENAERAGERLVELMLRAPKPECQIPFKCDYDVTTHWYETEYSTLLKAEMEKLHGDFQQLLNNHLECTEDQLKYFLSR